MLYEFEPREAEFERRSGVRFFCYDEIMSGKLFSERLQSKYQVADLAVRIISDFFQRRISSSIIQ